MQEHVIKPVAYIRNGMKSKFGIPRQSNIVKDLISEIVFTKEYRDPEALRGIEGFSHLWLIWCFSESAGKPHSPTVRPPRLGGNERVGVFATRSPYRPNDLGLSCVKLIKREKREGEGDVLIVAGADLMDGTPVFDIKPYLPYADCVPGAACGFAPDGGEELKVLDPENRLAVYGESERKTVLALLARDPRPRYHGDPQRVYGMTYGGYDIKFRVEGGEVIVTGAVEAGSK